MKTPIDSDVCKGGFFISAFPKNNKWMKINRIMLT